VSVTEQQEGFGPPGRRDGGEQADSAAGSRRSPVPSQIIGTRAPLTRNVSPWQRSHAVWQAAGIDWTHPGADPGTDPVVAGVTDPDTATKQPVAKQPPKQPATKQPVAKQPAARKPAVKEPATKQPAQKPAAQKPAAQKPAVKEPTRKPATRKPVAEKPTAKNAVAKNAVAQKPAVRESPVKEPPAEGAGPRRRVLRAGRAVPIALVVLLAAGAGSYVLLRGDARPAPARPPVAVAADRLFALDPAVTTDGRIQQFTGVASYGSTVVAIGSEQGAPQRSRFVTSADGGRTWQVGQVRAPDGDEPAPGAVPDQITGGTGGWLALGGTAVWTSRDGHAWTRQPDAPASILGPSDQVNGLARTASGFVAVGVTGPSGKTQGVVWTTPDGVTWQRTAASRFRPGTVVAFDRMAARGDTVIAHGTVTRKVTRTVTKKGKKSKVSSTALSGAFWRSVDGGRTWSPVNVPAPSGALSTPVRLVPGPGGIFAVWEVARHTGPKKRRKTVRSAVVVSSPDGIAWSETGQVTQPDYAGLDRLGGSDTGLSALLKTTGGKPAVLRSADGRTWRRLADGPLTADLAENLTGLAVLPAATVVVGGRGTGDAYLSVLGGAGDIDLSKITGMLHPDRTISALATSGTQIVAVGGGGGDAAVWTTRDGRTWQRAQTPHGGEPRRLTGAAHGPAGWVAAGYSGGGSGTVPLTPLVMTSADGSTWQPVTGFPGGDGVAPAAVTYGPAGYVVVGKAGGKAAAWWSADLKTWQQAAGDLGAGRWMSAVTVTSTGYVAAGARQANASTVQPAAWTSADGRKWTAVASAALPSGTGTGGFEQILARDGVVVAAGTATVAGSPQLLVMVSPDGGRTWQPAALPGGGQFTAATVTAKGFLVADAAGAPGRTDVELWTSADGRGWVRSRPHGNGLDGRGAQRLDALTTIGADLLAVGVNGDYLGDTTTLWRTLAP
jgi:hypothetical protein